MNEYKFKKEHEELMTPYKGHIPNDLMESLNYFAATAYQERVKNSHIDKFKRLQRIKQFSKRKGV